MKLMASLYVLGFALLLASPAAALPAPMPEEEMMEKSDLVAVVSVLSVTCTVITKDQATGEDLPSYLARLRVMEVKKGDAKQGDEVIVTWRAVPKSIVGPWAVAYYPGEVVLTHLVKKRGGVSYGSTWWNAKGEDIKAPASTELPKAAGETMMPPAMQQMPKPL